MTLEIFIKALIYALSAQVSFIMLVYFMIKARKGALKYSFIFFQLMILLWILRALGWYLIVNIPGDCLDLQPTYDFLNYRVGFLVGGMMGLAWLIFCLNYVEWKYAKNKPVLALMALLSLVFYLITQRQNSFLLFFDGWQGLGISLWIHSFVAYAYCLTGWIILAVYAFRQKGVKRKQTVFLILGVSIPLVLSLAADMRIMIFNGSRLTGRFDIVPVGFAFALAAIAFITFKYKFLNIKTIALNKIVDNLNQGVLIVDGYQRIVGMNPAFEEIFSIRNEGNDEIGLGRVLDILGRKIENSPRGFEVLSKIHQSGEDVFEAEIELEEPEKRFYEVRILPVKQKRKVLGRIITFTDITKFKGMMEELEEKNKTLTSLNQELTGKNHQLEAYAATVEELAVIKERNRFSRDVHDTMGHSMTVMITQLKVASILFETAPEKAKEKIKEILKVAKEGLNELRRSITGLTLGSLNEYNFESAIRKLISDFEASGVEIDFVIHGIIKAAPMEHFQVLFRMCQEALTNALRHGKAAHVNMVLNFVENRVKVLIKDDGVGCSDLVKGFGLTGMEERVKNLGGSIQCGSDGEKGFSIYAEIPLMGLGEQTVYTGGDRDD